MDNVRAAPISVPAQNDGFRYRNELKRRILDIFGLNLAARGGKNAKKRATVAVARKLAVMLHRLWVDEAVYHPFHQQVRKELEHAA